MVITKKIEEIKWIHRSTISITIKNTFSNKWDQKFTNMMYKVTRVQALLKNIVSKSDKKIKKETKGSKFLTKMSPSSASNEPINAKLFSPLG